MNIIKHRYGGLRSRITHALALLGCAAIAGTSSLEAQPVYQYAYGNLAKNEHTAYHPIEVTADGGTIMVGTVENSMNNKCLYLMKTTANGTLSWSYMFGTLNPGVHVHGYDVMEMKDFNGVTSGYVAIGSVTSGSNRDVYMLKVDVNGIYLWDYIHGEPGIDEAGFAIIRDGARYLATGVRNNPLIAGGQDVLFLRTDTNGTGVGMWYVGAPGVNDAGYGITMGGNTAIICGTTMNNGMTDGLILGMDPFTGGQTGIPRRYGSPFNNDTLYSIVKHSTRFLAAGTVHYSTGPKDMWALDVNDATRNPNWGNTYSVFYSGPNYNRINLGADIQSIGATYALLGNTAYDVDQGATVYTRYIVLSKLNPADGSPVLNGAMLYGTSTVNGKFSHGYGLRPVGLNNYLVGGMENHTPVGTPSGGRFDAYLIRANSVLSSSCYEDDPQLDYNPYTSNDFVEMDDDDSPIDTWSPHYGINYDAIPLKICCVGCKTVLQSQPAPEEGISLDVHGDPATGDVHILVSGMEEESGVEIYDALGRLVRTLELPQAGATREVLWNGVDDAGAMLPSGLYLVAIQGSSGMVTRTVQLTR